MTLRDHYFISNKKIKNWITNSWYFLCRYRSALLDLNYIFWHLIIQHCFSTTRPVVDIFILSKKCLWRELFSHCDKACHLMRERPPHASPLTHHLPCPSSLNTSSLFSDSFSFFPRRRFFPPLPVSGHTHTQGGQRRHFVCRVLLFRV